MKKSYVVLITIGIETIGLWLVSFLLDWVFIDTLFLGGLVIFGGVWLFQVNTSRKNNQINATTRGWTRQDVGEIKPFRFTMSPITLGLLLFVVISFFIAVLMYYPYFIS